MTTLRKHLRRQMGELQQQYQQGWRSTHEECSTYLLPRRGRFLETTVPNRGDKRNTAIINNTPLFAVRTLASGLLSGVTSPSRPWFRLTTNDPDMAEFHSVREWLDLVAERIHKILNAGNLYSVLPAVYEELGVFGTAGTLIYPDYEDVVRFYPVTAGQYFIANDARLNARTIYREFSWTVSQVVEEFGIERVCQQTKRNYMNGNMNSWVTVCHAIEPNDGEMEIDGLDVSKRFPYRSIYWEKTGDDAQNKILRQGGHESFRGLIPRWYTTPGEVYGRSPGMDALGDAKQLQQQERVKGGALEKMINPPMKGPANLLQQPHSTRPGQFTYYDEGQYNRVEPLYEVRLPIDALSQDIQMVEQRINQAFYVDLFMMLANTTRRQITAREIEERHEEKLLMLGPVLERLYDDLLDPLVTFVFDQMAEVGILPPPPPEIEGQEIRIELISIMAQAQKLVGAAGIDRFVGFVGGIAGINPDAVDKIDVDGAIDEYAELIGVPARLLTETERLKAVRQAKQQQAMTMQSAALAKEAAGAMKDASQAEIEGADGERRNVLSNMVEAFS